MKAKFFGISALLLALSITTPAHAAKVYWGSSQSVHKIQPLELKDSEGKALFLGFLTETNYFVAGTSIRDQGYVLGLEDKSGFYPLDAKKIAELQQEKSLPDPLPGYSIGWFDYVIGYSLWWTIALVFGIPITLDLLAKRKQKRAAQQGA